MQLDAERRERRDAYRRVIHRLAGPPRQPSTPDDAKLIRAAIDAGLVADAAEVEEHIRLVQVAQAKADELEGARAALAALPSQAELEQTIARLEAELRPALTTYREGRAIAEGLAEQRRRADEFVKAVLASQQHLLGAQPLALGAD